MSKPPQEPESHGTASLKYFYFTAVAVTSLFLGYLWGNQSKTGEVIIGQKGLAIKIADRERVETLIDNILDPSVGANGKKARTPEEEKENNYQRQALIDHLAAVIKRYDHNSYMGRTILGIAENSADPFSWEYDEASIEYDPTIRNKVFIICTNASGWKNRKLSVQVKDMKTDSFTPDGKEYYALPQMDCTPTNRKRVRTNDLALVQASRKPGMLAQARGVVSIPQ
jgi:hypothetical protein